MTDVKPTDPQALFASDLDIALAEIRALLIEKNRKYGDSALNPVRITTKADPRELITARFDDKLKRLQSGQLDEDEDVWSDLRGYAVLLAIYDLRKKRLVSAGKPKV